MKHKYELIKTYYTTHYRHIISQTAEGWNQVVDEIELNFGDIFSSLPKDSTILDVGHGLVFDLGSKFSL